MSNFVNIALVKRDGTDFSDLNADLDAERTAEEVASGEGPGASFQAFYGDHAAPTGEICPKCKGKGRYTVGGGYGRMPRDLGPCFPCGGTGSVSPEKAKAMRAHAKGEQTKANNEQARREAHAARMKAFIDANPELIAYCGRVQNDFTANCMRKLGELGEMTPNQVAAIRRSLEAKAAREQEQAKHVAASAPAGSGIDLSNVPAGRYAVPNGDTRLKVMIRKPAAPNKWAGFIFVSDAAEYGNRQNYGRQAPGKTYSGKIGAELAAIAADPKAAAVAYGKLTGTCSICGRPLENAESVERGIGPICAEKEGW